MSASFWSDYYRGVFERSGPWLDYSNEKVQAQTFGLTLEAAGPIHGRRCMDIGCGRGQLSRALLEFGASEVTGIDLVPDSLQHLRTEHPEINWLCSDIGADPIEVPPESLDLVLMIEVLQYTPFHSTVCKAWGSLAPGGRLVVVVPNADCPLVGATQGRFDGNYQPPDVATACKAIAGLSEIEHWSVRGLIFDTDQRISPYLVTPWMQELSPTHAPPNRLQFVAIKKER